MGTQVTLVYKVEALGISSTKINPFVASAPIPLDVLQALGLRIVSDTTTAPGVNPVVRTIVLSFVPTGIALILQAPITNTSRIEPGSIPVDPAHTLIDYILPPITRADNNAREPLSEIVKGNVVNRRPTQSDAVLKAYMAAYFINMASGGSGYTAATTKVAFLGGLPPANFNFDARKGFRGGCVRYVNIANPGRGYNPLTARLNIQGGGPDGNTPPIPAQGILTINPRNGSIQSIQIVDMGSGYVAVPDVFITTTDGVAPREVSKIYAVMAEGRPAQGFALVNGAPPHDVGVTITDPGDNYVSVPDILITDPSGGTGAIAIARMGVGRVDVISQGIGYFPGTTISFSPAFEEFFPSDPLDPQTQAAAFFQFLQGSISQNAITPLTSVDPLVA